MFIVACENFEDWKSICDTIHQPILQDGEGWYAGDQSDPVGWWSEEWNVGEVKMLHVQQIIG